VPVGFLVAVLWVLAKMNQEPDGNPAHFSAMDGQRLDGTATLVACIGDSITHGRLGHNWVQDLRESYNPEKVAFVNAGVNGEHAWTVAQRLDKVLTLKPDATVLLIGTNDCMGTFDEVVGKNYLKDGLTCQMPTQEFYRENLRSVLSRLQESGAKSRAVATLPPIGEDASSAINQQVATFNEDIINLAQETNTTVLPLNERLWQEIRAVETKRSPSAFVSSGWGLAYPILRSTMKHYLFGTTWDQHGEDYGLVVLTDQIHLNERGAGIMRQLVSDWLDSSAPGESSMPLCGAC